MPVLAHLGDKAMASLHESLIATARLLRDGKAILISSFRQSLQHLVLIEGIAFHQQEILVDKWGCNGKRPHGRGELIVRIKNKANGIRGIFLIELRLPSHHQEDV